MRDTATIPVALLDEAVVAEPVFRFAEASQTSDTLDQIDDALLDIVSGYGIGHFVLYQATDRGRRPTGARIAGPIHRDWRKHYVDNGFANHDKLLSHGLTTVEPTTWTKFQAETPISDGQKVMFDEARSFGLQDGFYLPIHQPDGSMHGVSMMVPHKLEADSRLLSALHMLAIYYSIAANRLGLSPPEPPSPPEASRSLLTPRQRQCLQWVRAGKSSWEIGEIMSLSEHTINEHLGEARRRLNVHTTTQAVIEAALRGLIHI
ncbi:MAG: LuxR family transcriptional regulator [Hyphomonadaceae bacterium]|nr:LuxR family transcriptional regulator [Hyphomonadaceae bacterium]